MINYLRQYEEEIPEWLRCYQPGQQFSWEMLKNSRFGFHPCGGFDGILVEVGNKSHSLHLYIYVDDRYLKLDDDKRFFLRRLDGYQIIDICRINDSSEFVVYERCGQHDESHGAERLAIIFYNGDSFDFYRQYVQSGLLTVPFIISKRETWWNYDNKSFKDFDYLIEAECGHPAFCLVDTTRDWEVLYEYKSLPYSYQNCFDWAKLFAYTPRYIAKDPSKELDEMFDEAAKYAKSRSHVTASDLIRYFFIGYDRAKIIITQLEEAGVI